MKVTMKWPIPAMTLEEFAHKYGLEVAVGERAVPVGNKDRYWAHFDRVEVKEGGFLTSVSGNGATPEEAVADYAPKISLKTLVKDAYRDSRLVIHPTRIDS